MKRNLLASFGLACCLFTHEAAAEIVGYINETFFSGYNFFCNQLSNSTPNNTLNSVLGSAPVGAAVTYWTGSAWAPYSVFNGSSWSINYDLPVCQGAVLHTTSTFTNTFVGEV